MTPLAHYNLLERIGEGGIGELFRAGTPRSGAPSRSRSCPPRSPRTRSGWPACWRTPARLPGCPTPTSRRCGRSATPTDTLPRLRVRRRAAACSKNRGGAPMNPRRALDLAVQIADGVADAHSHGILHGDLRPETIIVTAKGNAKVLDFGLAPWTNGRHAPRQGGEESGRAAAGVLGRARLSVAGAGARRRGRPADRRVLASARSPTRW